MSDDQAACVGLAVRYVFSSRAAACKSRRDGIFRFKFQDIRLLFNRSVLYQTIDNFLRNTLVLLSTECQKSSFACKYAFREIQVLLTRSASYKFCYRGLRVTKVPIVAGGLR